MYLVSYLVICRLVISLFICLLSSLFVLWVSFLVSEMSAVCYRWISVTYTSLFRFLWRCEPTRAMASSFTGFLDHTPRRTTFGRTPLYEWSARRRDLYLTTHNTTKKKSMSHGGIRTHDFSKRAVAGLRLRPRGYCGSAHVYLIKLT